MGKLILYGMYGSPPVRACLFTLKALQLPFEFKKIIVIRGDQFSEDYLKKNPQHTVPTLEDDGHFIWDSHAIMAYLVSKYGKNDELYPKELLRRALVDQRLHFESGVVFQGGLRNIFATLLREKFEDIPEEKFDAITGAYDFLETFLAKHTYMAGENITIADFSLITTITTLNLIVTIDAVKYPKLTAWIKRMEQTPYYKEANEKGLQHFKALLQTIQSKSITLPSKL